MIELDPGLITVIMLGGILVLAITGFPIALVVGGLGIVMGYLIFGGTAFEIMYTRVYSLSLHYPFLAVPLFTFMGVVLQRSGIAAGLYDSLYLWLGGFRGGLAIATVIFGTILAACLGVIAAAITMLTLIALAPMVKKGYDKSIASGACVAGGTLGILIPPSIMLIVYGPMAGVSVAKMFIAAVFPGLILSGLYIGYIAIRCLLRPEAGPPIPIEERGVPFITKTWKLLVSLVPPVLLIVGVLGSVFLGLCPPTESAAVGSIIAVLLTLAYRKFSWDMLKHAGIVTLRVSAFVLFIGCLCYAFVGIFMSAGCGEVVKSAVMAAPGGKWGAFALIMLIVFLLGMFIEWIGIIFIIVPLFTPIAIHMGFNPLWFSMMVCINLQMAFMSPPLAMGIFICKGTAAPELGLTMADIIKGVIPHIILVMVGMGIFIAFPQIITWLPDKMITGW